MGGGEEQRDPLCPSIRHIEGEEFNLTIDVGVGMSAQVEGFTRLDDNAKLIEEGCTNDILVT